MKKQLEKYSIELSEKLNVQRNMAIQFDELKDPKTAEKIRILSRAYSDCLNKIKGIIMNG
jgi:hypothetical protein